MKIRLRRVHFARGLLFAGGLIGLQGGCSAPLKSGAGFQPVTGENTGKMPVPRPDSPPPLLLADPPEPIYRNPKIGVVYLRAHQDEQGRLLGPQVMYEVTDAGGWNVDAAEQGKGYIPAANREIPAGAPPIGADQAAHVTITGLMDPADQARAGEMARREGDGRIAVFDEQAGWLILPKDEK